MKIFQRLPFRCFLFSLIITFFTLSTVRAQQTRPPGNTGTGFFVKNGNIYDKNGAQFIIRGVNNVHWWANNPASIPEIAKTKANAVRVVFGSGLGAQTPSDRQAIVASYISNQMVPIVELHDATCGETASSLSAVVDIWLLPANQAWLKQYEDKIIINIANEWGPFDIVLWRDSYKTAITRFRNAGINALLMIDGGGACGQNPRAALTYGQELINFDPQHNVAFSVHMYAFWRTTDRATDVGTWNDSGSGDPWLVNTELQSLKNAQIPFIVGEFSTEADTGEVAYNAGLLLQFLQSQGLGWLAWVWFNPDSGVTSMANGWLYTSDANLTAFGNQVVNNSTYGLKATSVKPNIWGASDQIAPGIPPGLSAGSVTSTGFTLSWNASTDNVGVTGYEVFRNGTSIGNPSGTSFNVTGLIASTTYAMTVRARDAAGNWSAQSSALNVTTSGATGNLALNRPVVSSSNESSGFPASNAVDGNATSRWSSAFSDPQWIYVDLGSTFTINRVVLRWEAAFGRSYQIQTSGNASTWTSVFSTTTGDGGIDDIALIGSGRYIRMNGTTRGTTYGYSLYELEVYGSSGGDTQSPSVPAGLASSNISQTGFTLSWTASSDNTGVTGYEVFRNGTSIGTPATTSFNVTGLTSGTTYSMTVRARDAAGNWSAQSSALNVTTSSASSSTVTLNPLADTDTQSDNAAGTNTVINMSRWNDIFMKFGLSSITGNVTSAHLRIYKGGAGTGILNVNNASPDSWTEGGTKPTLGTLITTAPIGSAAGYIDVDVTGRVITEAAGDDLITFGLTTNLDTWIDINSRENTANKPQLVVTYGSGSGARMTKLSSSVLNKNTDEVTIYPNPARGQVVVSLTIEKEQQVHYKMIDFSGHEFLKSNSLLKAGQNSIKVNTVKLSSGIYILLIEKDGKWIARKVILMD